jgi:hypothetical protein
LRPIWSCSLVRQRIVAVGEFDQSFPGVFPGVELASGFSHSAINGGLLSKLSDRSLGEISPGFHDAHLMTWWVTNPKILNINEFV